MVLTHLLQLLLRARLCKGRVEGRHCLRHHGALLRVRPALVHDKPGSARWRLCSMQHGHALSEMQLVLTVVVQYPLQTGNACADLHSSR
jgi:hypothetical protein